MKLLIGVVAVLFLYSCEVEPINNSFKLTVPKGFPEISVPNDNALSLERIALGKRLFYDPILSKDSTISCNSCHFQEYAFADNRSISPGVEERLGKRNFTRPKALFDPGSCITCSLPSSRVFTS